MAPDRARSGIDSDASRISIVMTRSDSPNHLEARYDGKYVWLESDRCYAMSYVLDDLSQVSL